MRSARTINFKIKTLIVLRQTWQTSLFMILNLLILQSGGTTEKEVKVATLRNEHAIYSAVFTYAMKELFLIESNVWHSVTMP